VGAVANQQFQQAMTTALAGSTLPVAVKDSIRTFGSALFAAGVAGAEAAGAAFNADTNNRQLHPREIDWIRANRARFAQQQGITETEAEKRLADQAFRQVQFGAAGTEDAAARQFLTTAPHSNLPGDPNVPGMNAGYMFYATPAQRLSAAMYLEAVFNDPKALQFYRQNNIQWPTVEQMAAGYARDAGQRAQVAQSTIYALLAAGALVLSPTFSGVAAEAAAFAEAPVAYCTTKPQACTAATEAIGCAVSGVACPVGSLTGELAAARKESITNLSRVLHQVELGTDPAKGGKYILDEAVTGARLEAELGSRLSRETTGAGDWVARSGKVYDAASPPPTEHFNEKSFGRWQESIQSHLNKQGIDVIVVDIYQRGLNSAQAEMVIAYLASLPNAQRARILILR
jgi:hypothetical protein